MVYVFSLTLQHKQCVRTRVSKEVRLPYTPTMGFTKWEAVFAPNPMRYRPIWSCDFRYNFIQPMIKSQGKSAPASNWFTVTLANQSVSRWNLH